MTNRERQAAAQALRQQEYVADPGHCPVCRSTNIIGHEVTIEGASAYQEVNCDDCDAEWVDAYRLSGYTLTSEQA